MRGVRCTKWSTAGTIAVTLGESIGRAHQNSPARSGSFA
jgi:hypothetical protein